MSNGEEEASNMINDHFVRESENQFILRVVKESKLEIKIELIERFLILFRTFLLLSSR